MKKSVAFITATAFCLTIGMTTSLADGRHEVLMAGDQDEWVRELQEALKEEGFFDQDPTGYFGTNTQNAVIEFQKAHGMSQDGKAGPVTRKILLGDSYREIPESRPVAGDKEDVDVYYPGDRADAIKEIQQKLKDLEYYEYDNITGYFGPVTEEAVRRFQSVNGLEVDGVVGANTMELLNSGKAKYFIIYPGDEGDYVKELQTRLKELNYFSGSTTGYFGSVTEEAVKAFQKKNGLTVDGKVGKNTREKLYSSSAKKNATSSSQKNNSNKQSSNKQSGSNKQSLINKAVSLAKAQVGKPYGWGKEGPSSFDCSGLVYYILRNCGESTSRMNALSFSRNSEWQKISSIGSLQAGDLVFFKSDTSSSVNHAGIYIGGNQIVHASQSAKKVVVSSFSAYYKRNFVCGRRVF